MMATTNFPPVVPVPGQRQTPSQPAIQARFRPGNGGGFTLFSTSSGIHWHVINEERPCHYGRILHAVRVVTGTSLTTGALVMQDRGYFAIKEIDLQQFYSQQFVNENPVAEASALQYLKDYGPHPNIIEVTEVLQVGAKMYIILPYCHHGDLFTVVSTRGLRENEAKAVFANVLDGMFFVHASGVCHRDLSLENILLDNNGLAKIIDFGMALKVGEPHGTFSGSRSTIPPTGPCGKASYMAPEVARINQPYDGFAVDVWACGAVLFMMLARRPPFNHPPVQETFCDIVAVHGRHNLPMSDEAIALIQSCFEFDPQLRPSIADLQRDPWFRT